MSGKPGKKIVNARKHIEARPYMLEEAAEALKKAHFVKFDESVDLVLNLGVDPKHSDQMVRGTVVLPHGLGKSKRVIVIATGEKVREAEEAGALGRTQDQQRLYTQQQEQIATNPATDALLGGALNATVSSRVQKLFGAGSVKVDPNYLGVLGNSTTRITVEEQLGKNLTLTYATDVDTTAQQLLQAEIAINRHVSLLVARDESGVFSMVVKATRRFK